MKLKPQSDLTSNPSGCLLHIVFPFYENFDLLSLALKSAIKNNEMLIRSGKLAITVINDNPEMTLNDSLFDFNTGDIQIINNSSNLGMVANFNKCISISRGAFTQIMGQDDLLNENHVPSIISNIENKPDVFAICLGVEEIDSQGLPINFQLPIFIKKILSPKGISHINNTAMRKQILARLAIGNFLYFPSIAFNTHKVLNFGFRDRFGMLLDYDLICRALLSNESIFINNESVTFLYRRHGGSVSEKLRKSKDRFCQEKDFASHFGQVLLDQGQFFLGVLYKMRVTSRFNHLYTLIIQSLQKIRVLVSF